MSWLNVTVKIPASWWPDRDESEHPFNVFACIANTLYNGDGNIDVDTTDDGGLLVSTAGHARYGMCSIDRELGELVELRIPYCVEDDGQGDETAPSDWHLYDGHDTEGRDPMTLHFHGLEDGMTYGELKAILAGEHAWAKTPLEFFENAPTIERCSIEHLLDAPHPDDEEADHYDDTTAVL